MLAERPGSNSVCKDSGPRHGHAALAAPHAASTHQQQKSSAMGKQGCHTEGPQVRLALSILSLISCSCGKVFLPVGGAPSKASYDTL